MSETNIRQLTKQDIPESVDVIRTSFLTVGKEFNITPENAPMFTAYASDEVKINFWMDEQHRLMYGFFIGEGLALVVCALAGLAVQFVL